ncbi:helix-turn-helix domain-containing protein [Pseudonocardia sp. RS010]|uniref:TetR/AcrR family transcriptional regulator n=1 Tax=Pseudonocardia sp. RS010 TaxID=3385979 RepID=UPI0039A0695C
MRIFSERGFEVATLDEIARGAGVARSALYRHFPNKSELFVAAVLQPLVDFQERYLHLWREQVDAPWDDERYMRGLVTVIVDICASHREAMLGLITAEDRLDPETADRVLATVGRHFDDLVRTVQPESDRRGWVPPESLELSLRLLFGSIMSVTVLHRIFLPADPSRRPERGAIIEHVTRLFLHGAALSERPGG